jgi:CRISPR-associated protein Csd1
LTDDQACNISLDASQKAHYALSWLISRQGYIHINKDRIQAIVAWATSGDDIPQPFDNVVDTQQDLAISLRKKIAGYNQKIDPNTDVVIMGLDSATTGRLAITYYRELKSSDFFKRLDHWHESCAWLHTYRFVDKARVLFIGAPAPKDIALAAYGVNRKKEGKAGEFKVDDNLAISTANRILPCIVDGLPIPRDIVESAVRNASNRVALEDWQWKKTLSIACALYKKHKEGKEIYDMALDETRTTRDYLYGRLLAIADRLEEVALYAPNDPQKKRATNATRYMQQFSLHPYRTWGQIHSALIPYMVRLDGAFFFKNKIAEVKNLFKSPEDFANDKPLSGEYLLGYYSQRQKLLTKKKQKDGDEKPEE